MAETDSKLPSYVLFPGSYSQNLHQQLGHDVNAEELVVVQDNRDLTSRYGIDFSKS